MSSRQDSNEDFAHVRDSFCVYPFLDLTIAPGGMVKPCCAFGNDIENDGRVMSVYEYTLAEIWNSRAMREIRQSMVAGEPVPGCAYCYRQAKQKFRTIWQDANDAYAAGWLNPRKETIADLKARAVASDFYLSNGPERLDLDVGNLCNLKCRMCHSGSSSSVAADPVQVRWPHSFSDAPIPARWRSLETIIAPRRVIGVTYSGLSEIDWSKDEPVAWVRDQARLTVELGEIDLVGVTISLDADRPVGQSLRVLVDAEVVYEGTPPKGPWSESFPLEKRSGEFPLQITIEPLGEARPLGITKLALKRGETGRNSISIGRFEEGKQWFQSQDFIEVDLFYDLNALTKVNFIGGEPLLIKEVRNIMRFLIAKGRAKDITLSLTTNGTVMDAEWSELASHFKSLIIAVSLDGYGDLNDYIRYPSDWSSIETNIAQLQAIPNAYVYVNMTIQPYNMLRITELIDFCEKAELDFRYHAVVEPVHLNCNHMPDQIRSIAADKLRRYALRNHPDQERPNRFVDYRRDILALAEALETPSDDNKGAAIREFMIFTNDLDLSRGQNFASVAPEMVSLLAELGFPWIDDTRYARLACTPKNDPR